MITMTSLRWATRSEASDERVDAAIPIAGSVLIGYQAVHMQNVSQRSGAPRQGPPSIKMHCALDVARREIWNMH